MEDQLDTMIVQNKQNADETNGLLETIVAQNEKNNPQPELETIIKQNEDTKKTIDDNGSKVADAVKELKPVMDAAGFIANFMEAIKGDKGDTPVKGKDYLTDNELSEIKKEITPVKGSDYFTDKEIEQVIKSCVDKIPVPKDGIDGVDGVNGIDGKDGKDGIDGKDATIDYDKIIKDVVKKLPKIKKETQKSIEEIVEELKGKLSYDDLKDLPVLFKQSARDYDFLELKDVPNSYIGQASKIVKVKADESGLEFGDGGSGGGSVESVNSGSGTDIDNTDPANPIVNLKVATVLNFDLDDNLVVNMADTSTDGYLASGDWNTFNSKQDTLPLTNPGDLLVYDNGLSALPAGTSGQVLTARDSGDPEYTPYLVWEDPASGGIASVVAGTNISVDITDPANPIVSFELGTDENFVTDAEKTVLGNTSGTNTGDQELPTRDSLGLDTDDTVTFANLSGTNTGDQDLSGYELLTNKVTSWQAPTTDTNYPSEKLVKDTIDLYTPTSTFAGTMTVNTGTLNTGTVTDLQAVGGTDVDIQETTGMDALRVTFDFTGVVRMSAFTFYGYYDGGSGHEIEVEIYNQNTTTWDVLGRFATEVEKMWYSFPIFNTSDYISSGAVSIRLMHVGNGNTTHQLILDFLEVSYGTSSGSGSISAAAVSYTPAGDLSSTNVGAALNELDNEKVAANADITGATKTKITYDAKGLVTAGADATTADIADSTDKRYVTDAQLTVLGNTSGTNTGDQDLSGLVTKSTYDANSILYATTDNTPVALTVGASTFVGRKATGDISAMSATEARTILNVADGATANTKATGAEIDTGTDDAKFATAKALKDSHNVPSVAPGTSGNVLTSNGTDWTSATPSGGSVTVKTLVPLQNFVAAANTPLVAVGSAVNTARFTQIVIPFTIAVNKISFYIDSGAAGGALHFALYSEDGQTKLWEETTETYSSNAGKSHTTSATRTITPGIYYIGACQTNTTSVGTIRAWSTDSGSGDISLSKITSGSVLNGTLAITDNTFPSTFTPSSLTAAQAGCIYVRFDN